MDPYLLAKISTLSILIPIGFGIWANMIKAEVVLRLFLLFLMVGFSVDALSWYQHLQYLDTQAGIMDELRYADNAFWFDLMRRSYGLLEALFFLWFVLSQCHGRLRTMIIWSCPLVTVTWVLFEIVFPFEFLQKPWEFELAFYQAFYRVLVAFYGGFTLLQLVEHHRLDIRNGANWLLFGVFTYNLATFFVMILQRVPLGERLWYLHNVFNMLTYLICAAGFFKAGQMIVKKASTDL